MGRNLILIIGALFMTIQIVTIQPQIQNQSISDHNSVLSDLEPEVIWRYFDQISRIPRGSGNEQEVGDFIMREAAAHNCYASRDAIGNVIVRKVPSSSRFALVPLITMQSHLDMVCEKNRDVIHDFTKDPIKLVRQGHCIGAQGTTLGADNGIGVCAMLALISSNNLDHGPLEFLFTVSEETTFEGVRNLTPATIQGRTLLNLDTEENGSFYVGCAGGCEVIGTLAVQRQAPALTDQCFTISITGLKGGHSGIDINSGRANAICLLARLLTLAAEHNGTLVMLDGGNKRNAIPRDAQAVVAIPFDQELLFQTACAQIIPAIKEAAGTLDPDVIIDIQPTVTSTSVIDNNTLKKIIHVLTNIPHGMMSMSPDIEGLIQTSTNLARVFSTEDSVVIETSQRSLSGQERDALAEKISQLFEQSGLIIERSSSYPAWKPALHSPILKKAEETYVRLYAEKPSIKAIHAGLECGEIGDRIPGMDMISFGPTIYDAHSPDERVDIEAVKEFWLYLTTLLADLAHS